MKVTTNCGVTGGMPKFNLFTKIIMLIVMMLVPIIGLYFYSNKTSTDVLGQELNNSNMNQLTFFQNQVNTSIDSLAIWPHLLIHDPDISSFKDIFLQSEYLNLDAITVVKRVQTKLSIQESSFDWKSKLQVYSPSLGRVISVDGVWNYSEADIADKLRPGWQVQEEENGRYVFSLFTADPYAPSYENASANIIIEIQFGSDNIVAMLDKFKSDGRRDPVYYNKEYGVIYNRTANRGLTDSIIEHLETGELGPIENRTVSLVDEDYLVNIVQSRTTGWYLIDYMPLSDILQPIRRMNSLFYASVLCLLLMALLIAYLLYAGVQVPLRALVQGFQKLKIGDYSVRMTPRGNNEFSFVFSRFNSMVTQIQELFERVYLQKIHVREARLKQLQAQINPHFFYNCFSFISSMAKLQNHQAVIAMSQNLSKYYRYTTRQERDVVPLSEELDFLVSYLEILKMRKNLRYDIDIPPEMMKLDIPLLMLQPLVENAVIHGVECLTEPGSIRIVGVTDGQSATVHVEDNGNGLDEDGIIRLQEKLARPMDEEMGCGLWNVRQRMKLMFGEGSGLLMETSELGGLKVTLRWSIRQWDGSREVKQWAQ